MATVETGVVRAEMSDPQDEARTAVPKLSSSPEHVPSSSLPSSPRQAGAIGGRTMGQRLSTATSDRLLTLQGQLAALSLVREQDDEAEDGSISGSASDEWSYQGASGSTALRRHGTERRRLSMDGTPSEVRRREVDGSKAATMRRPQSMFVARSLALLPQDHADLVFPSPPKPKARLPLSPTSSDNLDLPASSPSRTLPPSSSTPSPTGKDANPTERFISTFVQPLDSPSALQLDLRSLRLTNPFPTRRPGASLPLGLPTIPSSPNPPLTPRRSPSETLAPVLPQLVSTPPLLTPDFWLVPPTATLAPTTSSSWPILPISDLYALPKGTYSTPELSLSPHITSAPSVAASAPISTSSPPEGILAARSASDQGLQTVPFSMAEKVTRAEVTGKGSVQKSYHALLELVTTEIGYLDSLRILVKVYFHTLPFLAILSPTEVTAVVRNAESLLALHERLVMRLSQVGEQITWERSFEGDEELDASQAQRVREAAGRIAQVFLDELPNFALYEDFCARHRESVDIIRAVESRPEWEAFERNCAGTATASLSDSPSTSSPASSVQENTPLASPSTTLFFPPPLLADPSSASTTATPSASASTSVPQASKLRFHDYAINPIQRICRYPMIFAQILKHLPAEADETAAVARAGGGLRDVAVKVDVAKSIREGELRTQVIAQRMEFPAPVHLAFCDILGPSRLIGSLHVVHRFPGPEDGRSKYYGCFLYRSHLVMAKIKKRDSYEPREWLPLRQFEIVDVTDGEGLLPHSIRLSHKDHHFELGATCHEEKVIWLASLLATCAEATQAWADQPLDGLQQPTLFDDTLVSSVYPKPCPAPSSPSFPVPSKWPHRRTDSTSSLPAIFDHVPRSGDDRGPSVIRRGSSIASATSQPSRSLSRTTSALFARIPSAQRATIDLRLSDIVSGELLAARMLQLTREAPSRPSRMRTISGTSGVKRAPQSLGRLTLKERRRMSLIEPGQTERDPSFRGPVGFDAGGTSVYRDEIVERKWSSALKKSKSAAGEPRTRPSLPMIDTSLAQSSSHQRGNAWKSRAMALRRVASHSSLDRPHPSASGDATEIERNNSVSSTASSSCVGSRSTSSQHTQDIETPPSSLPPSPDLRSDELRRHPSSASGKLLDGASDALRLKRRRSQLALAVERRDSPSAVQEVAPPLGLTRRGSSFGDYFQKRVASSPTLSTLFSNTSSQSIGRYHSNSSQPTLSLTSTSSPHLPLDVDTPVSTAPSTPGTSPEMRSSLSLKPDSGLASESGAARRAKSLRFAFSRQFKLSPISPVDRPNNRILP